MRSTRAVWPAGAIAGAESSWWRFVGIKRPAVCGGPFGTAMAESCYPAQVATAWKLAVMGPVLAMMTSHAEAPRGLL